MAMTALKERPIIFTAEMVRALLAGRKTQTRRPVKPQPETDEPGNAVYYPNKEHWEFGMALNGQGIKTQKSWEESGYTKCPYGKPGDRLWVREKFKLAKEYDHLPASAVPKSGEETLCYCLDATHTLVGPTAIELGRVRVARYMPRWASRLTLEITGVRVERVQAITEADALAEGVEPIRGIADPHDASKNYTYYPDYRPPVDHINVCSNAKTSFMTMWQSMYSPDPVKGWDANPWVWVVSFKRVED